MQAQVKANSPWRTINACAGAEFIKSQWRDVPAGRESEAQNNPFLETRDVLPVVEVPPAPVVEPVQTVIQSRRRTK